MLRSKRALGRASGELTPNPLGALCARTEVPMAAAARQPGSYAGKHFATVLVSSLLLHGVLLLGLHGQAHAVLPRPQPVRVTVLAAQAQVAEPRPEPVQPSAEPTAPTPAAPTASTRKARQQPKEAPQREAPTAVARPSEAQPASEPLDFTGVTLTSPGAGSWASVTGNGAASSGPLAAPPRGLRAGAGRGLAGTGELEGAARVVGLASLSRPPRAPSLDGALRDNYPRSARDQGLPGRALIRVRILADGRVAHSQVLSASAAEFGRACQRTLAGSRWSAPLDAQGQPVGTDVSYSCQFEVSR